MLKRTLKESRGKGMREFFTSFLCKVIYLKNPHALAFASSLEPLHLSNLFVYDHLALIIDN